MNKAKVRKKKGIITSIRIGSDKNHYIEFHKDGSRTIKGDIKGKCEFSNPFVEKLNMPSRIIKIKL